MVLNGDLRKKSKKIFNPTVETQRAQAYYPVSRGSAQKTSTTKVVLEAQWVY